MALIRPMRLADLNDVVKIEKASFPRPWSHNAFITQLAKDASVCLVAEVDQQVIGYTIATQYVEVWHLLDLAVREDYRRQYVATELLEFLFELCGREQHRGYTLEVRKSNRGAIKMYESFGFICTGLRKGYYSDNSEDALIMWKDSEDMLA
ncbi:MAG: ribosomal protein S18-alanine N-acetyltransferase [Actinobacteria bacterium]|nr:ribosomal protein S18-alanine N-acetyltransferase [Actinomycetota bacterium]